jgi:hypothetical protein
MSTEEEQTPTPSRSRFAPHNLLPLRVLWKRKPVNFGEKNWISEEIFEDKAKQKAGEEALKSTPLRSLFAFMRANPEDSQSIIKNKNAKIFSNFLISLHQIGDISD